MEALTLAARAGVDPARVREAIRAGPAPIFAGQMAEGRVSASPWTLAAILAYAGLSAIGAMLRWIAPAQAASFSRQS